MKPCKAVLLGQTGVSLGDQHACKSVYSAKYDLPICMVVATKASLGLVLVQRRFDDLYLEHDTAVDGPGVSRRCTSGLESLSIHR